MTVIWNDTGLKLRTRAAVTPAAEAWLVTAKAGFPSKRIGNSMKLRVSGTTAGVTSNDPRVFFFEEGVPPHVIEPKDGTVLRLADGRFVTGGVKHPGMSAQPTLKPLLRAWPKYYNRAASTVMRGRFA